MSPEFLLSSETIVTDSIGVIVDYSVAKKYPTANNEAIKAFDYICNNCERYHILKDKISNIQSSMATAQARILDVFGMGAMGPIKQANFDDDQINNGGMGMAA